jgi:WD40 repeat protein
VFGEAVAIDGNYAVAGAKFEDDASNANTGIAYIINASTGAVAHTLANPVSGANAYFGKSVAVSGANVVVGANGYTAGAVYIFSATTGSLIRTISNPQGASNNHEFGYSVAIDGNYLVVGAPLEDVSGVANTGRAYVFNVTSGVLVHTLENPNVYGTGEADEYGLAVAISGDRLIVSSYKEDDAGGTSSGAAYVYSVSTGTLLKTLKNPNQVGTSENDFFGWSCAINSNRMAIGAMGENEDLAPYYSADHGRTYVFGVS